MATSTPCLGLKILREDWDLNYFVCHHSWFETKIGFSDSTKKMDMYVDSKNGYVYILGFKFS